MRHRLDGGAFCLQKGCEVMVQLQPNAKEQNGWHPTEWHSWNEQEGELSARERLIAILAFKIGANVSLTQDESVAQLYSLPDEDIFAVLKMVELFNYWQQLTSALGPASIAKHGAGREALAAD